MTENRQVPTNRLAIASFVLSIISGFLYPFLGPVALVLGVIALIRIKHSSQSSSGSGLAIASIVISAIAFLLTMTILLPESMRARNFSRDNLCLSNIKCISLSLLIYAEDYDGMLPPFAKWNYYTDKPQLLICPSAESKLPSYALNATLRKLSLNGIEKPDESVMVFDSEPGRNRSGGPELLPLKSRHWRNQSGENIGFADGHAERVADMNRRYANWEDVPYPRQNRMHTNHP